MEKEEERMKNNKEVIKDFTKKYYIGDERALKEEKKAEGKITADKNGQRIKR